MYSIIVKATSLAALVLAAALTLRGAPQILMQLLVCGGALFVMMEAVRSHKYIWVAAFAVAAICFNPVLPLALSRSVSRAMVMFCALAFLASLRYLHPTLRMSLATITDLPARGESL